MVEALGVRQDPIHVKQHCLEHHAFAFRQHSGGRRTPPTAAISLALSRDFGNPSNETLNFTVGIFDILRPDLVLELPHVATHRQRVVALL